MPQFNPSPNAENESQAFSQAIEKTVASFIRLMAPYREFLPKQEAEEEQKEEEKKEDKEEKEEKISPPSASLIVPSSDLILSLDEENLSTENRETKELAQQAAAKAKREAEKAKRESEEFLQQQANDLFFSLSEKEKAARLANLQQINAMLEEERKEYIYFTTKVQRLSTMLCKAYEQAHKDNNQIQLQYLQNIQRAFENTVNTMSDKALPFEAKKQALRDLLTAATPSKTILEAAEPVISLGLAFVGAVIGGVAGLLVGAPCGAVMGVGLLLYLIISGGNIPFDATVMGTLFAIFGGAGALAGAVKGAIFGATQVSKYLYNLSHSTFFKPAEFCDEINGFRSYYLHCAKLSAGNYQIKKELLERTPVCAANIDLINEYLGSDDKLLVAASLPRR